MSRFVPRLRKHKARQRSEGRRDKLSAPAQDSNELEISVDQTFERDERRQKLRESLVAEQSKVSSQKKKRLDKYIVSGPEDISHSDGEVLIDPSGQKIEER